MQGKLPESQPGRASAGTEMTETVEKKAPAKAEKNIEKESSSGKSAAGKGAGAGAKKASSGAEPAVKAGMLTPP